MDDDPKSYPPGELTYPIPFGTFESMIFRTSQGKYFKRPFGANYCRLPCWHPEKPLQNSINLSSPKLTYPPKIGPFGEIPFWKASLLGAKLFVSGRALLRPPQLDIPEISSGVRSPMSPGQRKTEQINSPSSYIPSITTARSTFKTVMRWSGFPPSNTNSSRKVFRIVQAAGVETHVTKWNNLCNCTIASF